MNEWLKSYAARKNPTYVANIIIAPDIFEQQRETVVNSSRVLIEGVLQHLEGTVGIRARLIHTVATGVTVGSHDFH